MLASKHQSSGPGSEDRGQNFYNLIFFKAP